MSLNQGPHTHTHRHARARVPKGGSWKGSLGSAKAVNEKGEISGKRGRGEVAEEREHKEGRGPMPGTHLTPQVFLPRMSSARLWVQMSLPGCQEQTPATLLPMFSALPTLSEHGLTMAASVPLHLPPWTV